MIHVFMIMLFSVHSEPLASNTTVVEPDQRLQQVRVTSEDRSSTESKKDRRSKSRVPTGPTREPIVVVVSDPDGPVKCLRYEEGVPFDCERILSTDDVPAGDEVREAVRIATRSVGIPSLTVQTLPRAEALINIDTILYADTQPFERTVNLLGQDVTIRAVPSRFVWHHGDGTKQTTRTPGSASPSSEVTHVYRQPKEGLQLRVDTTWAIEFRVAGGVWQNLDETLTITGPVTNLTTREARPLLVSP